MAFASMFIAFVIMSAVALTLMLIVGIILLIIGLKKKKKYMEQGRKFPYIFIISGAFLMSLPILIIGVIIITGVFSEIKTRIKRQGYENFTDKWKNEWVSDHAARDEALKWLVEAADEGDRDAIISVFTEEIQDNPELEAQVDEFLEEYPGGLSNLCFEEKSGSVPGSVRDGKSIEQFYYSYEVVKDNERYYIEIGACYQNDIDSDKVGIEYFIIKSERAEVYYDDITDGHSYDEYILADIEVEGNFETRRIWGYPWKFYEIDRTITREEIIEAVESSRDLDELEDIIGEPNGVNESLREVAYEIEPDGNEPRYAVITYDYYENLVGDIQIAGETQEYSEWIDIER